MSQKKKLSKQFKAGNGRADRILTLQDIPLPADTISDKYISAGWLLANMDLAGGKRAHDYAKGRTVTVGVERMSFHKPVFIADQVSIFTEVVRQGRTSLTLKIESWARRRGGKKNEKVTEGYFTFVATTKKGKPMAIPGKADPAIKDAKLDAPQRYLDLKAAMAKAIEKNDSTLAIRTIPLPRDTNYLGDIFGGWILANMDMACLTATGRLTSQKMATVGLESMTFYKPVHVGDEVSFYANVIRKGDTSLTMKVETWARPSGQKDSYKVTEGCFTYVALGKNRKAIPLKLYK